MQDPRYRTKVWLDTYLRSAQLTKDDDSTQVTWAVLFAYPEYPFEYEFNGPSDPVDLIFAVDIPHSEALPVNIGYIDSVPIIIYAVSKTGITGTKLRWKAEAELRYVTETYPTGSLRTLERVSDNEKRLGSTVLYSVTYTLRYKRYLNET